MVATTVTMSSQHPWQLALYERSLKKRRTIDAVLRMLPSLDTDRKCLEIGCQTGISSYFLRQRGGTWTSVDFEADHVEATRDLVGGNVLLVTDRALPFETGQFDVLVGINFLEHIIHDDAFLAEMARVLKPGGMFILTAPTGESWRLAYHLKRLYRFTADAGGFGHARDGYPPVALRAKLTRAGLTVELLTTYSRLFGEVVEDTLNYAYYRNAMRTQNPAPIPGVDHEDGVAHEHRLGEHGHFHGHTTVTSGDSFAKVSGLFRLYSLVFPVLKAVTMLDNLIRWSPGYMLAVRSRKVA